MTLIVDDPARFTQDALRGFCDAHADRIRPVHGGVVRSRPVTAAKVAVVIGGGSGHYPAFCGTVGTGMADGAVVGNIFTSPSAVEVESVARAADSGAGVLFSFGNYAGDVMHFGLAAEQLRASGIDSRTVVVTDDIASAPAEEESKRRGIAGDFCVFKLAGAAAEAGYDLDGVERIARSANARCRTMGVAMRGCTLPGANEPLFTVGDGSIGVGLGIHGEPGIDERPMPSATELAAMLVDGLLAERPEAAGRRVAVVLNGLGATKYEELYLLWRVIAPRLADAGLELVEPEVGELVTSLDMTGCSLSLLWLDEETEPLWRAPADTPGYSKTHRQAPPREHGDRPLTEPLAPEPALPPIPAAPHEGQRAAARLGGTLHAVAAELASAERRLGEIDAAAGDGDHGRGMTKGSAAASETAAQVAGAGGGPATLLRLAGRAWAGSAGGTSGALWGAALTAFGGALDDAGECDAQQAAMGAEAALVAVGELGGAQQGDKTMLDALIPFVAALRAELDDGPEDGLAGAWRRATAEAESAAEATAQLVPRVGRARPLAERSRGVVDAGATSLALVLRAVGEQLEQQQETERGGNHG